MNEKQKIVIEIMNNGWAAYFSGGFQTNFQPGKEGVFVFTEWADLVEWLHKAAVLEPVVVSTPKTVAP